MPFTHPQRVLYPERGLTKLGLATYYAEVSAWILPHLADRPLSLVRCPEGREGQHFYQKHAAAGTPEAVHRIGIREKEKPEPYLMIDNLAGLLSLVQMSVLELHPWGCRRDDIDLPDRITFDLDPDVTVAWSRVIEAARELRQRLGDLGLVSFVKTTGGKGLHVVVPIQRRHSWAEVGQFAKTIAQRMVADAPGRYVAKASKAARAGKIYIDYLRNKRERTRRWRPTRPERGPARLCPLPCTGKSYRPRRSPATFTWVTCRTGWPRWPMIPGGSWALCASRSRPASAANWGFDQLASNRRRASRHSPASVEA